MLSINVLLHKLGILVDKRRISVALLMIGIVPASVSASSEMTVKIHTSADASTGNQAPNGGTVMTGSATTSTNVQTIINGRAIESIDFKQAVPSEAQRLDLSQTVRAEPNQPPRVETRLNINGRPARTPAAPSNPVPPAPRSDTIPSHPSSSVLITMWGAIKQFVTSVFSSLFD